MSSSLWWVVGVTAFWVLGATLLPGVGVHLIARIRRSESRPAVLGPLFADELTKLARRGTQLRLRVIFVAALLIILFVSYTSTFRDQKLDDLLLRGPNSTDLSREADFAERFFHGYLCVQILVLTILMPVFAGGTIVEEGERKTIDYLRTTLLSNREIVVGKLMARLVYVLSVAAAGFPVLTLMMLLGGVDGTILTCTFAVAISGTFSLAAFSLWTGTRHESLFEVMRSAFILVVILVTFSGCCGCVRLDFMGPISPIVMTIDAIFGRARASGEVLITMTILHVCLHGAAGILCTILAMGAIRIMPSRLSGTRRPIESPHFDRNKPLSSSSDPANEVLSAVFKHQSRRERPPPRWARVPAVGVSSPLAWKERYFSKPLRVTQSGSLASGCTFAALAVMLIPLSIMLLGSILEAIFSDKDPSRTLTPMLRFLAVVLLAVVLPVLSLRAIGTITRERQQQTLDTLFIMPIDRVEILQAKWSATARASLIWIGFFFVVALICVLLSSCLPYGLLWLIVLIGTAAVFFPTMSLWLSVRCANAVRAATWYVFGTFAAYMGLQVIAMIVALFQDVLPVPIRLGEDFLVGLSMPYAADSSIGTRTESRVTGSLLAGALVGVVCFWLASWWMWRSTVRQFDNEGR